MIRYHQWKINRFLTAQVFLKYTLMLKHLHPGRLFSSRKKLRPCFLLVGFWYDFIDALDVVRGNSFLNASYSFKFEHSFLEETVQTPVYLFCSSCSMINVSYKIGQTVESWFWLMDILCQYTEKSVAYTSVLAGSC